MTTKSRRERAYGSSLFINPALTKTFGKRYGHMRQSHCVVRLRLQRLFVGVWLVATFPVPLEEALKFKHLLQYPFRTQVLFWVPLEESIAWCEQHQVLSILKGLQVERCCPW